MLPQEEEVDVLEKLVEEDLPKLQEELSELQIKYDESSMKKHITNKKMNEFSALLDTNLSLLERCKY